jgi:ApaG protein
LETAITFDIRVSVESVYYSEQSDPKSAKFVHIYNVTIENLGQHTVQLIDRHWYIWDSCSSLREVQGPGVIGQQPVLKPNDIHRYQSGSQLTTNMGKMYGNYSMLRLSDNQKFEIDIPPFNLIVPAKLN